ncbi:MAG TPA: lysyl oxidase family protein, partial [Gaiellaceae bacterium]
MGKNGGERLRGRRRAAAVALAAAASVLTLALAGAAPGVGPDDVLPNLVSDPPENPQLQTYLDGSTQRLLLRFDGFVHNSGLGPVEIRGQVPVNWQMTTRFQRISQSTGGSRDDASKSPLLIYENADGHQHWHLRAAARYMLFDETRSTEVAPAMKTGFCLADSEPVESGRPRVYTDPTWCEQFKPDAASVMMGISSGWRDRYPRHLPFQWVDVSDVRPGTYWLASEVDPDDVVIESDESNPIAFAGLPSVIPGYIAQPLALNAAGRT